MRPQWRASLLLRKGFPEIKKRPGRALFSSVGDCRRCNRLRRYRPRGQLFDSSHVERNLVHHPDAIPGLFHHQRFGAVPAQPEVFHPVCLPGIPVFRAHRVEDEDSSFPQVVQRLRALRIRATLQHGISIPGAGPAVPCCLTCILKCRLAGNSARVLPSLLKLNLQPNLTLDASTRPTGLLFLLRR
jgi:hypothetical protein